MPPRSPRPRRPRVTLVAAVGRNRVIGKDGWMPWHLPEDLAHFKALTHGHTIIMGRRTWDAIGRPLPGRATVVVTRDAAWSAPGARVAHSLAEAIATADAPEEVFVVGGGQIYAEALSSGRADRLVLTEVDAEPEGDTFFPEFPGFTQTAREPHEGFDIVTYDRG